LLDLMIPDIAGVDVLRTLRRSAWGRDLKVLVISNLNEGEADPELRQLGIEDYVVKVSMTNDTVDKLVNKVLRPGADTSATDSPATGQ
jgi:DNA-binding response OmpR family regulator